MVVAGLRGRPYQTILDAKMFTRHFLSFRSLLISFYRLQQMYFYSKFYYSPFSLVMAVVFICASLYRGHIWNQTVRRYSRLYLNRMGSRWSRRAYASIPYF